jgi:CRISPR-associated protein Csb2
MMLVLAIDYLNGWVLAAHPSDRELPEWPPHPDRVFMALAAAHFETDGDADERRVLEWLEALGQPSIYLPEARLRSTVTTFVPVNDTAEPVKKGKPLTPSGSLPIGRDRQPRTFPIAVLEDAMVHLAWDSTTASDEQRQVLDGLCRKVTHVGHSASLVRMYVVDQVPEPGEPSEGNAARRSTICLRPSPDHGRYRLRVSGRGRLADLEGRFNGAAIEDYSRLCAELRTSSGRRQKELKASIAEKYGASPPQPLRPTPFLWQGYDSHQDKATTETTASVSHWNPELLVLSQVDDHRRINFRRYGLESTLLLTRALRNCVMRASAPQPPPEWLSGHRQDGAPSERVGGHVAFLPLPHVGRRHADGHLLGLALAVPREIARGELARCLNALLFDRFGRAATITLTLGSVGTCSLRLQEGPDPRESLRPETWTRAATRWATVTPIAFDRHGKRSSADDDIETMIADACERIGLPRPVDVVATPVSLFVGAPTAREMPRIERKSAGGKIRHVHAAITFPMRVVGPVLLGCGRYRGYGLCRPIWEGQQS